VNDHLQGRTPLLVKTADEFGLGSIYIFKAELAGYKTDTKVFKESVNQDANGAIPGSIHFVLVPAEFNAESRMFGETADSPWGKLRVLGHEFDTKTRTGKILIDVAGKSSETREWVVKNIGKIVASREIQKAGQESSSGGKYRVLKESVVGGVLLVEFTAEAGE
jgi:hypothetical protein